ncbi:MAG: hypothetical protein LBH20_06925 [Treponema sp.]|jgi:hypothetical protein|nr:hypothetical protein [Treponema sp.]
MAQQINNPKHKETINEIIERKKIERENYEKSLIGKPIGEMTEDELLEEFTKNCPKIVLSQLNNLMEHNSIGEIEKMLAPPFILWPEYNLVIDWLVEQGGIIAIEKWRQFDRHEDFEKKRYPKASEFKQSLLYWLDNVYQETKINGTTEQRDELYQLLKQNGLINPKEETSSSETKDLPTDDVLEQLAKEDDPVLRKWNGGKYKCKNLRQFVDKYAKIKRINPTKNLIDDYLVKEKEGKPFQPSAIISTLNTYGISPERKKTEGRTRRGTHKKDSI